MGCRSSSRIIIIIAAVTVLPSRKINIASLTGDLGTTEYHVRRMFSSLAGMPLSEYIRRRRMTVAAADVLADRDLLGTAVRYRYSSTEAFNRAFRAVHGITPSEARRNGGPLRSQPQLRFRLTLDHCPGFGGDRQFGVVVVR